MIGAFMKIYAKSDFAVDKDVPTQFDKCIGKDVWVKCHLSYNEDYEFYARFLEKEVLDFGDGALHPMIYYNKILAKELLNLDEMPRANVRKLLTASYSDYAKNIIIDTPIKIIDKSSLDHLLGDSAEYETTESILDKYVGKDVWLRVDYLRGGGATQFYIKLLDKEGYYYTYIPIFATYVEEHWDLDPEETVYSVMHPWRPSRCHIDDIVLSKPIEILTPEEIQEELEKCAEQYYIDEEEYDEDDEYDEGEE